MVITEFPFYMIVFNLVVIVLLQTIEENKYFKRKHIMY